MHCKQLFFLTITFFLAITVHSQVQPGDEWAAMNNGNNYTTIPDLQSLGKRLLNGKTGSIVAINPSNGEILCLATNSPTGEDPGIAIARAHAPGSTIKVAQALTFLTAGIADVNTAVECQRGLKVDRARIRCHKHYSPIKLKDAIAFSCNSWFLTQMMAMISHRTLFTSKNDALNTWGDYMRSMGLGGPLGVDIPGEKGGLIPKPAYMDKRYNGRWNEKTIMWVGMGQGDITVTPLQLCNLAASIANKGIYYVPHIHKDSQEKPLDMRYLIPNITMISPDAYDIITEAMRWVMTKGTGLPVASATQMCGKTGTAENEGKDHSVFLGFAPMNDPQIAVSVFIEHGGWGADLAAPIASLIAEQYIKGKLSPASEARAQHLSLKSF